MGTQRVVVGVDFSDPSVEAARWAARCFGRDAELVLVHAIYIPPPPRLLRARFPNVEQLANTARVGAELRLRELSKTLGAGRIWMEVRVGRPAEEIARVAKDYSASLVVVGKHGERPGIWKLLGSTAEHVLRTAETSVMIVNAPRGDPPRRLLAAVDDSDVTATVLEWAALLARRWEADVTAVQVVSAAVMSHVLSMASIGAEGDVEPTPAFIREEFVEDTTRWEQKLLSIGLERARTRAEVTFGDAAQEIVAAAERLGSDVIVIGETGTGAVPRLLVGSTLRVVLRSAQCPVLVVARGTTPG